jgi:hypothetical protein
MDTRNLKKCPGGVTRAGQECMSTAAASALNDNFITKFIRIQKSRRGGFDVALDLFNYDDLISKMNMKMREVMRFAILPYIDTEQESGYLAGWGSVTMLLGVPEDRVASLVRNLAKAGELVLSMVQGEV